MNFSRNEIDRQIDTREIYRYQIDRCRWIDDIDRQIDRQLGRKKDLVKVNFKLIKKLRSIHIELETCLQDKNTIFPNV